MANPVQLNMILAQPGRYEFTLVIKHVFTAATPDMPPTPLPSTFTSPAVSTFASPLPPATPPIHVPVPPEAAHPPPPPATPAAPAPPQASSSDVAQDLAHPGTSSSPPVHAGMPPLSEFGGLRSPALDTASAGPLESGTDVGRAQQSPGGWDSDSVSESDGRSALFSSP
ncbi:hypothetical protein FA95DRAFT_1611278 [Auriscalpium vulgare]|uniref:Uncharacterized protein n=1 Tax=Auriscalpium vulgare TaxID=40419 RepID=A0ACB8RAQ8_9AGAM|nr:hypothetical protein FA95DRAFT_1611278 [Auriscalpium vulgare]